MKWCSLLSTRVLLLSDVPARLRLHGRRHRLHGGRLHRHGRDRLRLVAHQVAQDGQHAASRCRKSRTTAKQRVMGQNRDCHSITRSFRLHPRRHCMITGITTGTATSTKAATLSSRHNTTSPVLRRPRAGDSLDGLAHVAGGQQRRQQRVGAAALGQEGGHAYLRRPHRARLAVQLGPSHWVCEDTQVGHKGQYRVENSSSMVGQALGMRQQALLACTHPAQVANDDQTIDRARFKGARGSRQRTVTHLWRQSPPRRSASRGQRRRGGPAAPSRGAPPAAAPPGQ